MRITLQTLAAGAAALLLLAGCGGKSETPAPAAATPEPAAEAPAGGGGPMFGGAGQDVKRMAEERLPNAIAPDKAKEYLAKHPETLVLDVRGPEEWNDALGHLDGSRQIPLAELPQRAGEIRDWVGKPILIVSRVGDQGEMAADMLRKAGYNNVANLDGGLEAWRKAGY